MMNWLVEPFTLPFVQKGLVDVLVLSVTAGLLGTWIVLRGLSFYSHAVGPATFPGVVLAGGLGFSPVLGAFVAALLFAGGLDRLSRNRKHGYDSLTALSLVGMLVVGIVLASDVFYSGSDIDTLLFGSLLLIGPVQIGAAAFAALAVVITSLLLGRIWLAIGFDSESARSMGLHSSVYDSALFLLIALTAAAAVSTVGALLMTTLFIVPAATTRMWARRLLPWQAYSIMLVCAESVVGLWLSVKLNSPPGAPIAIVAGCVFAVSALVGTARRRYVIRATRQGHWRGVEGRVS